MIAIMTSCADVLAGRAPKDAPVTPEDLVATVYSCLGIPLATEYTTPLGRPVRLLAGGTPIDALLA